MGTHAEAIATYDRVALYYAGRGFFAQGRHRSRTDRRADRAARATAGRSVQPRPAEAGPDLFGAGPGQRCARHLRRGGTAAAESRPRSRRGGDHPAHGLRSDRANALPYLRLAEALCRVTRISEADRALLERRAVAHAAGSARRCPEGARTYFAFPAGPRVARVTAQLYLTKGTRESGMQALARLQLCFEADPRRPRDAGAVGAGVRRDRPIVEGRRSLQGDGAGSRSRQTRRSCTHATWRI